MTDREKSIARLASPRASTRRRAVENLCRMSRTSNSILEVMELTLLPLADALNKEQDTEVLTAGCRAIAKSFDSQLMRNHQLVAAILEGSSVQSEFAITFTSALQDALHDSIQDYFSIEIRNQISQLASLIPKPDAENAPRWALWRSVLALHPLLRGETFVEAAEATVRNILESPALKPWDEISSFLKMRDKALLRKFLQVRSALLNFKLPNDILESLAADEQPFTRLRVAVNENCSAELKAKIFADILELHHAAGELQRDTLWFQPLSAFEMWKENRSDSMYVTFVVGSNPKLIWLHYNTGFLTFFEETELRRRIRECSGLPTELADYLRAVPTGEIRENLVRKHNRDLRFARLAKFSRHWANLNLEDRQRALSMLAFDTNVGIREIVAKNSNHTPTLQHLATDLKVSVRALVAARVQDGRTVFALRHDKSLRVRMALATRSDCPKDLLEELVAKNGERGRIVVAKNESCPESLLCRLARDESHAVRRTVASRPSLPASVIEILANDGLDDIRILMLKQENANETWIEKVVSWETAVNLKYLMPPYADVSRVAERVLRFCGHALIRAEFARNPATPVEDLMRYAQDSDDDVRMAVAYNPSSTAPVLEILRDDSNPNVKSMVMKRLGK